MNFRGQSNGSDVSYPLAQLIIIKQEMLEPFQITQSELMGQYFGIHGTTTLESQIR